MKFCLLASLKWKICLYKILLSLSSILHLPLSLSLLPPFSLCPSPFFFLSFSFLTPSLSPPLSFHFSLYLYLSLSLSLSLTFLSVEWRQSIQALKISFFLNFKILRKRFWKNWDLLGYWGRRMESSKFSIGFGSKCEKGNKVENFKVDTSVGH